jgi:hypothetical protein
MISAARVDIAPLRTRWDLSVGGSFLAGLTAARSFTFYGEKVEAETLALPPSILANFPRITELIEEF